MCRIVEKHTDIKTWKSNNNILAIHCTTLKWVLPLQVGCRGKDLGITGNYSFYQQNSAHLRASIKWHIISVYWTTDIQLTG